MKAAAEKVLDEGYLPSHSQQYREAYHPAYRVLHKDFRKFPRNESGMTSGVFPDGESPESEDTDDS